MYWYISIQISEKYLFIEKIQYYQIVIILLNFYSSIEI